MHREGVTLERACGGTRMYRSELPIHQRVAVASAAVGDPPWRRKNVIKDSIRGGVERKVRLAPRFRIGQPKRGRVLG